MSEPRAYPYATYLNVQFPALSLIDVASLVDACTDRWYNQTLCKVNDSVVRLGVLQGEYHWHKHDNDDEFFFVLEGHFIVDLEGRSVDLGRNRGSSCRRALFTVHAPRSVPSFSWSKLRRSFLPEMPDPTLDADASHAAPHPILSKRS